MSASITRPPLLLSVLKQYTVNYTLNPKQDGIWGNVRCGSTSNPHPWSVNKLKFKYKALELKQLPMTRQSLTGLK